MKLKSVSPDKRPQNGLKDKVFKCSSCFVFSVETAVKLADGAAPLKLFQLREMNNVEVSPRLWI